MGRVRRGLARAVKGPVRRAAAALLHSQARGSLLILCYHRASARFDARYFAPGTWSTTLAFERQIRHITERYRVAPLHEALEELEDGGLEELTVAVTVDDGASCLTTDICPILLRYRCPATLFITSSYLRPDRLHFALVARYLSSSESPIEDEAERRDLLQTARRMRMTTDPREYAEGRERIESLSELVPDRDRLFVPLDYLATLDPDLFHVGLHGHEHQRFSMMPAAWQGEALDRDLEALAGLPGYRPVFAIPFGGPGDWNHDTIHQCLDRRLRIVAAAGGINHRRRVVYDRATADGADIRSLLRRTLTGIY